MSNSENAKCPKCGNPYIRTHSYNPNYIIFIHEQEKDSRGLKGLIKYCIVTAGHYANWPTANRIHTKLNPNYRTTQSPE